MAKKVVVGVEIDTKDAQNSIDKLNSKLEELNQNAEGNADAIKEVTGALEDLGKEGKQTGKDIADGFGDIPGPIGEVTGKVKGALGMFKSLGTTIKLMAGGVKSLAVSIISTLIPSLGAATAGFGALAIAIIATGIGALVVALGAAIAYFTQTEAGIEAVKVAFAALGEIVSSIGDAFADLFTGDAIGFFKGLTTELVANTAAAIDNADAYNKLEDAQRKLNVRTAESRAQIEGLKKDSDDITKSLEDRTKAAEQAAVIETELLNDRIALSDLELKLKEEEIGRRKDATDDEKDELAELQIARAELAQESLTLQTELQNKINGLREEQNREDQAAIDEATKIREDAAADRLKIAEKESADAEKLAEKEAERKLDIERQLEEQRIAVKADGIAKEEERVNLEFQRRLALIIGNSVEEIELRALLEEQQIQAIQAIRDRYKDEADIKAEETRAKEDALRDEELAKVEQLEADKKAARQATADQSLAAASNFIGAVQQLNNVALANQLKGAKGNYEEEEKIRKKGFAANKALQITNAVIQTAQAVIAAYSSAAAVPIAGIALGPIMAAAAGIAGAVQIAAIAATQYSPTGGGSTSTPRPPAIPAPNVAGITASLTPSVQFAGSGNNLNTVGGGAQPPINVNSTVSITEIESVGGTVSEYEQGSLLEGGG